MESLALVLGDLCHSLAHTRCNLSRMARRNLGSSTVTGQNR